MARKFTSVFSHQLLPVFSWGYKKLSAGRRSTVRVPYAIQNTTQVSVAMNEAFNPRNELERQMEAAQDGRLSGEQFMQDLMETQVFMPVKDDSSGIQGFQRSDKAVPLTLKAEDGTEALILFSSPERAKEFLQDFPDYDGGLLSEFKWILERVGAGIGIAINPGWEVGIDMEPEMVQALIDKF